MMTLTQALYLLAISVFGLIAVVSPVTIARVMMLWPRFIFPILLDKTMIPSKARDALDLSRRDPNEYARRFWYQLLIFRISGAIALLIVTVTLVISILGQQASRG